MLSMCYYVTGSHMYIEYLWYIEYLCTDLSARQSMRYASANQIALRRKTVMVLCVTAK